MSFYNDEIIKLKNKDNFRHINDINAKHSKYITVNGRDLLNFSSNDYLNLSTDKELIEEFISNILLFALI